MNPPSADVAPTHPNRGEFASVASGCHLTAVTRFPNSVARHAVANANAFGFSSESSRRWVVTDPSLHPTATNAPSSVNSNVVISPVVSAS